MEACTRDELVALVIARMGFSAVAATSTGRSVSMGDLRTDVEAGLEAAGVFELPAGSTRIAAVR